MTQWTWDQAQDKFPAGHLVSGFHDRDRLDRLAQIRKLLAVSGPRGQWAARKTVERGEPKLEVLFELETDAAKLGDALGAHAGAGVPGYGSHRWYEYTPLKFRTITSLLDKAAKAGSG